MIQTPYLLFLGDAPDSLAAKVAQGIKDWRPEFCVGQYRMENCKADLGLPDMTLQQAREAGAKDFGHRRSQSWWRHFTGMEKSAGDRAGRGL